MKLAWNRPQTTPTGLRAQQAATSPTVLRPESNQQIKFLPPDPGRNRPETFDFLREVTVRTLPQTPRGRGETTTKERGCCCDSGADKH
jgi:hypothetical protein